VTGITGKQTSTKRGERDLDRSSPLLAFRSNILLGSVLSRMEMIQEVDHLLVK
jgi:hypothetical protein